MPRGIKRKALAISPPSVDASLATRTLALDRQFVGALKQPKYHKGDVILIVDEKGLKSCDELLNHAQHLCRDSQDRRLLDFCVNLKRLCGVRTGLLELVEVGMSLSNSADPPEHTRPLTLERLAELKALARREGEVGKPTERIDKPTACLDLYMAPGEFTVAPRDGTWSLRMLYEVLVEGRCDPILAGLSLAAASQGGFSLPCSEVSWTEMQKPGSMGPSYYGDELARRPYSEIDKRRCDQQLRFDELQIPSFAAAEDPDAWIEAMPQMPSFEKTVYVANFGLRAKFYVEAKRMIALIRAFERAGHVVTHTVGVKFNAGQGWKVTAKRHKSTKHKHARPELSMLENDAAFLLEGA